MIKSVVSLIRTLQSNASPSEIAGGAVMALYFGLTPLNHTHVIFLVLAFFLFKINRGATLLLLPFVKLAYYLGLAVVADKMGYFLLVESKSFTPFWGWVTQAPVLAYLDLNYTLVVGGIVLAAILTAPLYALIVMGVNAYRARYRDAVSRWQIVKWAQNLSLARWLHSWWPHD